MGSCAFLSKAKWAERERFHSRPQDPATPLPLVMERLSADAILCPFTCAVVEEMLMKSSTSQLPSRFPVGTRYVVEGSRGSQGGLRVRSRYLEFPDGKHLDLPVHNPDRRRSGYRLAGRPARK